MSTLTALKCEREIEIARRAIIGLAPDSGRPALSCQWTIDPHTGRPVAVWTELPAAVLSSVVAEPDPA